MIEKYSSNKVYKVQQNINIDNSIIRKQEIPIDLQIDSIKPIESPGKDKERKDLEALMNSLNEFIQPAHTSIKFELHDKLEEYYVKVINDDTKEVIREIPSKKMLNIYAAMKEFLGLMVDEKI